MAMEKENNKIVPQTISLLGTNEKETQKKRASRAEKLLQKGQTDQRQPIDRGDVENVGIKI